MLAKSTPAPASRQSTPPLHTRAEEQLKLMHRRDADEWTKEPQPKRDRPGWRRERGLVVMRPRPGRRDSRNDRAVALVARPRLGGSIRLTRSWRGGRGTLR